MPPKSTMVTFAIVLAFLVVIPMVLTAMFGRSFLYHPTHTPPALLAQPGWELTRLQVAPGIEIVTTRRPTGNPAAPWLIFFGGNAMGLDAAHAVLELCRGGAPWGLAAAAYRGYDGSDGSASQKAIFADAEAFVAHLGVNPSSLVLIGQSLGSGVAAHVAAVLNRAGTPARGLVLLSPYTSIARIFDEQVPVVPVGWLAPDPYRTIGLADALPAPILIIHGTADSLIPFTHGQKLAKILGDKAELLALTGREHNDLWEDEKTVLAIRRLVSDATIAPVGR